VTIFVFGSNEAGKHYGGAALYAHDSLGAEMGVGEGRTGEAYALPTLTADFQKRSLEAIAESVEKFKHYAYLRPELHFQVTRVGCGIAGFADTQIAPLFLNSPANCGFDPAWSEFGLPTWTSTR
jgi:hypothetical protein